MLEACTAPPTVTNLGTVPTSICVLMLKMGQPDRGHMLVCSARAVQGTPHCVIGYMTKNAPSVVPRVGYLDEEWRQPLGSKLLMNTQEVDLHHALDVAAYADGCRHSCRRRLAVVASCGKQHNTSRQVRDRVLHKVGPAMQWRSSAMLCRPQEQC